MSKINLTLLIIDDHVVPTQPLVTVLKQNFEEVVIFNRPRDGLDYIKQHLDKRLIIILDIKFPDSDLDGHSILTEIRKLSGNVPVMLWSAVDEKDEPFSDFINNNVFAFLKQTTPYHIIVQKVKEANEFLRSNIASAIEEWINRRSKFDLQKPYLITCSDGKQYSLEEILKEVRLQTPFGLQFSKDLNILTIDLLLRRKESF